MTKINPKVVSQQKLQMPVTLPAAAAKALARSAGRDELSTGAGKALRLAKLGLGFVRPADLATARGLKDAVTAVLSLVRLGKPIAEKDEPRAGPGGRYTAPNGDPLIRVKLNDGSGVPGSSEYALVNPKTNQFYKEDNVGGFMHPTNYYGPMSLPKGTRFEGKHFSEADLKKLEKVANAPKLVRNSPAAAALKALAAGTLDFSNSAPRPGDILSSKVIKSEHPFTYTAIVLKSDPEHVIVKKVLTGGFVPAGPNDGSYSQPIAID